MLLLVHTVLIYSTHPIMSVKSVEELVAIVSGVIEPFALAFYSHISKDDTLLQEARIFFSVALKCEISDVGGLLDHLYKACWEEVLKRQTAKVQALFKETVNVRCLLLFVQFVYLY